MILMRTLLLYLRAWRAMAVCGIAAYLALLPATLLVGLAGTASLAELAAGALAPGMLLVMLLRSLLAVAAAAPLLLGGAAFAAAATMAAVAGALRGRPPGAGELLAAGARRWWPMLCLFAVCAATLALGTLGPAALLAPLPPVAAALGLVAGLWLVPAFGFHAPYLLVAGGLPPGAAWRAAAAGLRLRPAEHLWSGVVLAMLGAAVGAAGALVGAVPLAGGVLALGLRIFLAALQPLYMAGRFERRVRPWLREAGRLEFEAGTSTGAP